jgi:rhamnosyltransferase subunit B
LNPAQAAPRPTEGRMQVLISCVGSAGDVHPFLAIGQALVRRGHAVELLASPHFQARIVAAGLGFCAYGTEADYQRILQRPDLWHARRGFGRLWQEMQPQLVGAHDALVTRVRPGRTVLVGSTLAWHVRLAQETQGLPGVTVHLSPSCVLSALAPARLAGWLDMQGWPVWAARAALSALERGVIDRQVGPGLDAVRRQLGLRPVRRILSQWMHSPQRVVCAWPDDYAPAQVDWPAQAVTTDFVRWPSAAGETLAPALGEFLSHGPAPVGFTPGSAMAHGQSFFEQAVRACKDLGLRAVFITPFADQLPRPLPDTALAVAYAPFDLLLPRLRALVHHGGIGTGAQAAAAGLPQGFVPFAHDQFDNAARWVGRGLGLRLPKDRRAWTQGLDRLVSDPTIAAACARYAAAMASPGEAPQRIADLIEQVT